MTRDPRQVDREYLSSLSGCLDKIQMIDRGALDLHQDLVTCDRRRRDLVEYQRPAVLQQPDSFHASSPCQARVVLDAAIAASMFESTPSCAKITVPEG